ncbi:pentapeptide repeat-containing protein [Streptacidiphilus neutrinimicus]|uniref:pentapeptide repeat-containing protein n=1 Tax=Streptacidiphilus neutrinimicus TaxID=105420 RepID=UPI0005A89473|nr:pentapeptide repeat-containing protein [Streptacidiphilus neutrinimicus]
MTVPLNARQWLAALPRYAGVRGEDFGGRELASARALQVRFTRCSFRGVDLRQATLDGCSLTFCDLSGADLRGASLRGVRLAACDLRAADLRGADLSHAGIGRVNTGAPPYGLTDATGVRLAGALLHDVRLDDVIGWLPEAGEN